jgi:hypothetical protein
MSRRRQSALLATGVITVAASLAACGSPITTSGAWHSLATLKTTTHSGIPTVTLAGPLLSAQGTAIAKTAFSETCTQIGPVGEPSPSFSCLAIVNTGVHQYVAAGNVAGPYGKLQSLALPATLGSLTITNVTTPTGKAQQIEIYASKGLNGNDDRVGK